MSLPIKQLTGYKSYSSKDFKNLKKLRVKFGGVEQIQVTKTVPSYDPRNDSSISDELTEVQNQGQCQSCWALCVADATTLMTRIRASEHIMLVLTHLQDFLMEEEPEA